jgi:hypothetical protein
MCVWPLTCSAKPPGCFGEIFVLRSSPQRRATETGRPTKTSQVCQEHPTSLADILYLFRTLSRAFFMEIRRTRARVVRIVRDSAAKSFGSREPNQRDRSSISLRSISIKSPPALLVQYSGHIVNKTTSFSITSQRQENFGALLATTRETTRPQGSEFDTVAVVLSGQYEIG